MQEPRVRLQPGWPGPIVEETVVSMRPDRKRVCGVAQVSLAPGDGVLLKYAPPAAAGKAGASLPRVTYPKAVVEASEDKIIWLTDVAPIEMPVPGWYPALKFKGKRW